MAITNLKDQLPKTGEARLPFMVHLKELRDRLLYSVIAVGAGLIVGLIFGNTLIALLKRPAPADINLVVIELLENMSVYFKVSLTAGVIIAMPFLVYQFFAFAAPGLTSKEKRMIFTILPAIVFMFLAGVAFAYFVALPPALNFLYHFNANIATPEIRLSNYIDIVTRLLLVIGLVFETPIIIMGLARLGIVSPKWLAARRRMWIVLAFVIAAIITPTFDPINQTIVAVPLIILLELGILLARIVYKKRATDSTVK
jgi:sec-independent protein translocase protein TatC